MAPSATTPEEMCLGVVSWLVPLELICVRFPPFFLYMLWYLSTSNRPSTLENWDLTSDLIIQFVLAELSRWLRPSSVKHDSRAGGS
jgi:hypothetical protein